MRNSRISTSGLKSDVAIVFLGHNFLKDAEISAIRIHLRQIYDNLIFAWVFRTPRPKVGVLGGKIGEGVMRSSLETEWYYSGRKERDGQKKKIGKANG